MIQEHMENEIDAAAEAALEEGLELIEVTWWQDPDFHRSVKIKFKIVLGVCCGVRFLDGRRELDERRELSRFPHTHRSTRSKTR